MLRNLRNTRSIRSIRSTRSIACALLGAALSVACAGKADLSKPEQRRLSGNDYIPWKSARPVFTPEGWELVFDKEFDGYVRLRGIHKDDQLRIRSTRVAWPDERYVAMAREIARGMRFPAVDTGTRTGGTAEVHVMFYEDLGFAVAIPTETTSSRSNTNFIKAWRAGVYAIDDARFAEVQGSLLASPEMGMDLQALPSTRSRNRGTPGAGTR